MNKKNAELRESKIAELLKKEESKPRKDQKKRVDIIKQLPKHLR